MKASLVLGVIALGMLGTTVAEADCGCAAWLVTDRVVEGKPYIVLASGCAAADPAAPSLALTDARGTAIPFELLTTHAGYNGSRQFVITPQRALAPGSYRITHAERYLKETSTLTVVAVDRQATPPTWSSPTAKVVAQRQAEFGCGPAKTVEIEASAEATLAYVELSSTTSSGTERKTGYAPVRDGKLQLGHGMCSGEFALVKGRRYTAQITLLEPAKGTSSASRTVAFTYAP